MTAPDSEYIVFYGTLMRDFPAQAHLGIQDQLAFSGPCLVEGELYDLGGYPGLAPGPGRVRAELFRILDPSVLPVLDRFEDCDSANPQSEYARRLTPLADRELKAWVYLFNHALAGFPKVAGGDWAEHIRERQARGLAPDYERIFSGRVRPPG